MWPWSIVQKLVMRAPIDTMTQLPMNAVQKEKKEKKEKVRGELMWQLHHRHARTVALHSYLHHFPFVLFAERAQREEAKEGQGSFSCCDPTGHAARGGLAWLRYTVKALCCFRVCVTVAVQVVPAERQERKEREEGQGECSCLAHSTCCSLLLRPHGA